MSELTERSEGCFLSEGQEDGNHSLSELSQTDDRREVIKNKLRQHFDGKIVRKDLTKKQNPRWLPI